MIKKGKEKLMKIAEVVHLKFFGHPMSDTMREFLGNLSWSFFGGIIAAGIMFVVNVLIARWLGVEQFGKYNALMSLATGLSTVYIMGNDSGSVRYISEKQYKQKRGSFLSASLLLWFVQVVGITFLIFCGIICLHLNIERRDFVIIGSVVAVVISAKLLFDAYLKSLSMIRFQSMIKIIETVSIIILVILFKQIKANNFHYQHVVISMIFGALSYVLFSFVRLRKFFRTIKLKYILKLVKYNKFIVVATMGSAMIGFERFFVGVFTDNQTLGNYSVYYMGTFLVLSIIISMFMNVFWPTLISEKGGLLHVLKKIDRIFLVGVVAWMIIDGIFISGLFVVIGDKYSISIPLMLMFILAAYLRAFFVIMTNILNIDYVKESAIITLTCYLLVLMSLFVFRNIQLYLIAQIILYGGFDSLYRSVILKRYKD